MSATPTLISTVRDCAILIQNADGTANKSLSIAAPAAGSRIKSLIITSDDTAAQVVQLIKTIGAVDYLLGEIAVPAGSGSDSASVAIDALNSALLAGLQSDGISKWIEVANGTTINLRVKTAVTAAKKIYVIAEVGDFT